MSRRSRSTVAHRRAAVGRAVDGGEVPDTAAIDDAAAQMVEKISPDTSRHIGAALLEQGEELLLTTAERGATDPDTGLRSVRLLAGVGA
ncbi:hypothetical protein Ae406Ps2_1283c [Pseudonocardia sp. Ae406_Ps2]|uniref:hypothetical protein n=1 Tax=unclassified Pseudonocardia TaxID=2619320 RepID=UPI00094AB641|nr:MULTISPECIES: hypothetical protein [unclassified Pseudonocardia]OLM01283.1 hypothetical protein Ae406Ps2_1283c [Pseudonocardia sp. Ae406_Ps2]OLM06920.1 hypothetical protein Ae331Ps2_4630 [Pseudonocardia sp. Ae331_Ps2]OLM14096.1 hypothetical protein Ae505Ps2_4226 [Pseudonocardia sp. Ae505_Ps2]OLM22856.1 hypothetical protein Ae706Ps2_1288c [Pseudonocardia sp. Ae706_Ps2]OLM31273.1 hypothetical protein Ae717Ps2_2168 [Pseudonocardia sp. Ae717_Ps2]